MVERGMMRFAGVLDERDFSGICFEADVVIIQVITRRKKKKEDGGAKLANIYGSWQTLSRFRESFTTHYF